MTAVLALPTPRHQQRQRGTPSSGQLHNNAHLTTPTKLTTPCPKSLQHEVSREHPFSRRPDEVDSSYGRYYCLIVQLGVINRSGL